MIFNFVLKVETLLLSVLSPSFLFFFFFFFNRMNPSRNEKNTANKTANLCSPFVKVTKGDAISSEMGFSLSSKLPHTTGNFLHFTFSVLLLLLQVRTTDGRVVKRSLEIANQVFNACWQKALAGSFYFHISHSVTLINSFYG